MPKIPLYFSSGAISPGPLVRYGNAAEAAWLNAARAGEQIAQTGFAVWDRLNKDRERVQREADVTEALKVRAELHGAFAESETRLEREAIADRDARTTLPTAWGAEIDALTKQRLRGLSPNVQRLVQEDVYRYKSTRAPDIVGRSNALVKDRQLLDLRDTVEILTTQAAAANIADPRGALAMQDAMRQIDDTYATAVKAGWLTAVDADKQRDATYKRVAHSRALRETVVDPDGFLARVSESRVYEAYVRNIGPEEMARLVTRAETKSAQLRAQENAQRERHDKELAKQADDERDSVYSDMQVRAANGQLTLAEIDTRRTLRTLDDRQYDHLRKVVTEAPKDAPSQRDLYETYALDVHSTTPRLTERDIDDAVTLHSQTRGERGINLKDGIALKDRLREQRRVLREQGESVDARLHREGQALLDEGLRTRSPLEAVDPKAQRAMVAARQELVARSRLFKGKEDPYRVAQEILPRYQAVLGEQYRMELFEIRKSLRFQTPVELEQARQAGRVTPAEYEFQKQRFLDLERASRDGAIMLERQSGGTGGANKGTFGR